MGSVCRNCSSELGFASIQTDGHGSEFPEAPGNPSFGGSISKRVFLSELVQSHCTAGDLSRHNSCLSVSMVSDLLQGEQVVHRRDQPLAFEELGPTVPG